MNLKYVTTPTRLPVIYNINNEMNVVAKSKGLKIANLNVNSLLKHLDEIRLILINNALDILTINESKIDDNISNDDIQINGFNTIRKDRNRFGGGVVLRDSISFSDRKDLIPNDLEMVYNELCNKVNKSLIISSLHSIDHQIPRQIYLICGQAFYQNVILIRN